MASVKIVYPRRRRRRRRPTLSLQFLFRSSNMFSFVRSNCSLLETTCVLLLPPNFFLFLFLFFLPAFRREKQETRLLPRSMESHSRRKIEMMQFSDRARASIVSANHPAFLKASSCYLLLFLYYWHCQKG